MSAIVASTSVLIIAPSAGFAGAILRGRQGEHEP